MEKVNNPCVFILGRDKAKCNSPQLRPDGAARQGSRHRRRPHGKDRTSEGERRDVDVGVVYAVIKHVTRAAVGGHALAHAHGLSQEGRPAGRRAPGEGEPRVGAATGSCKGAIQGTAGRKQGL